MPIRPSKKAQRRAMTMSVVIALFSTAALVAIAARQSPKADGGGSTRSRASRAAINAAEERAIWAPPAPLQGPPAVTITGCLEQRGDGFRLKNTSGADAPTARSWKSAFFRKAPAPIDIVDAPRAANVASHVGEQVRVTGVLDDRDMRVRSLQRVAPSCT